MHVLHRPHLGNAVAVTAIAAVLAIVLTLAIASNLSDQAAPPSAPLARAGVQASVTRLAPSNTLFSRSPFTSLLTVPVKAPWGQSIR